MRWLAVLLAMGLVDALWTAYIVRAADGRAVGAAVASAGIVLMGGLTTLAYVADPLYLIPAALGAFAGTWITVVCHRDDA